jgi:regulatory protein YycI of two-component signal transduction system YycFG
MSMHLEGPWLSTTGRRKGKKKWASAEQKRQAELLAADWEKLKAKYDSPNSVSKKNTKKSFTPPVSIRRDTGPRIPSLDTGHKGAVTVKQTPQYTGNKIVGIGTMHKSNAVPIFSDQEAKDISSMRR